MSTPTPTLYHLILFHSGQPQHVPHSSIDRDLIAVLIDELDKVVTTPPELTHIDIWIDSGGGDAHAAYKLWLDLRHRAKVVRAIVPDMAKSAATLLAIGMDEIFMAPAAELGPLDAQIEHPARENVIVSALDITDSFEFLGRSAIGLALSGGASALKITGLPRVEVLDAFLRFSAQLFTPLMQKLDPHLMHDAQSHLQVVAKYAVLMLASHRQIDGAPINPLNARALTDRLVKAYPTHGHVISRNEARKLGLNIKQAEHYLRWGAVKTLHGLFLAGGSMLIEVIPDAELDGLVRHALGLGDDVDEDEEGGSAERAAEGAEPGSNEVASPREGAGVGEGDRP